MFKNKGVSGSSSSKSYRGRGGRNSGNRDFTNPFEGNKNVF